MFNIKKPAFKFQWLSATQRLILAVALAPALLTNAAPGEESGAGDEVSQASNSISTFVLPRTLNEGRDPFYPSSTRVIAMTRPIQKAAPGPARLELKGISGSADRRLAIINNRTMAVGEEQDVTTPQGRVRVMCLEIEDTRVKIRAQGQTRELMLRKGI